MCPGICCAFMKPDTSDKACLGHAKLNLPVSIAVPSVAAGTAGTLLAEKIVVCE